MSRIRIVLAATATAILAAPIAQAEPSEFRGFYAGAHAGYINAEADFDGGGDLDEGGTIGGLQIGYNVLTGGNLVWGIETDVSLTGADPDGTCPVDSALNCSVDIEGMGTLRARVGYASGDWLLYVTGGAAAAHFDVRSRGAAGSSNDDEGEFGWTAGAGIEYLVGGGKPGHKNVGLKVEYRFLQFPNFDIDRLPTSGDPAIIDLDSHVVMFGVNWHF